MTDPLAIHRLRRACEAAESTLATYTTPTRASDLRYILDAWDKLAEIIALELENTRSVGTAHALHEALTTMGQL